MRSAASCFLLATLAGCAAASDRPPAHPGAIHEGIISVSRGPCFGFCPVYTASVTSSGQISFLGERHTAVLGNRTRAAPAGAYDRLAHALATFRPEAGETRAAPCERRISDQPTYTIVWRSAGAKPATLTYDMGCGTGATDALKAALNALPVTLGIADWAAQTTRPDTTRG